MGNVAIFIDYENVYFGLINQYNFKPQTGHLVGLILTKLAADGNLLIKKAYADWERPDFQGAQAALKKAGIDPTFALAKKTVREKVSVWKETADASLMLDAMQTLYERSDIDEYVLVSGDRGTLDLIHRLLSKGKIVKICALETAIAKELQDAVSAENVISIEELLGIEPAVPEPSPGIAYLGEGKVDWAAAIKRVDEMEQRFSFVGIKLLRDKHGFPQEVINEGMKKGIFSAYQVPNPRNPGFPTAALKLNRSDEFVREVLES